MNASSVPILKLAAPIFIFRIVCRVENLSALRQGLGHLKQMCDAGYNSAMFDATAQFGTTAAYFLLCKENVK